MIQWSLDEDLVFHEDVDREGKIVPVCLDDDESKTSAGLGNFGVAVKVNDLTGNNDFEEGNIQIQNVPPTIFPEIALTAPDLNSNIVPVAGAITQGEIKFED